MNKEITLEEMRKIVGRRIKTDGLSDDFIRFLYSYIQKLPDIERAERDSLAGES